VLPSTVGFDVQHDAAEVRKRIGLAGQYAVVWSLAIIAAFAPLAVARYRRQAGA
jgi:hypothetical protein